MANVPYSAVPDVSPDAKAPDDNQRIEASPAAFGATIAQGAEKFGAGAIDLTKFWGKVQAQDASNNAEKEASDLLVKAKSLEGKDALDAQQSTLKDLDAIREKYRSQLGSAESQSQFDGTVTPYFNRFIRGNLDTHFVEQGKVVANKANTESFKNAVDMATTAGSTGSSNVNDPTYWLKNVEVARAKAFMAVKADAIQRGLWGTPEAQQAAEQKANAAFSAAYEARALTKPDEAWERLQDPKVVAQLGSDYDKTFKAVRESVTHAYVSRADALEVNDPKKAEQFVRDNEAKFGDRYGEALHKANVASSDALVQSKVAEANAKVGAGHKAPPHSPLAANARITGDSLATGMASALYGDKWAENANVKAEIGKRPEAVIGQLKAIAAAKGPNAFADSDHYLSTGTSNIRADGAWSRSEFDTKGLATIEDQIKFLRDNGQDMSRLRVIGVGPKGGGSYANDRLKVLAARYGAQFEALPASDYGPDGIHTTAAGYKKLIEGRTAAEDEAPKPGAITTGPAANIDPSIPPEGRALLATIGGPEAGGQYNVRYGGAHFEGYGDHPRIHQKIETGPNAGKTSDAAGRYQFLSSTWDKAKQALGLTDFKPGSQDKGAWWLAQKAYRDATGGDLLTALQSGDPAKLDGVARALHSQWTSLPGGIEEGTTTGRFAATYSAALQGHGASTIASREPSGDSARAAPAPGERPDEPIEPRPKVDDATFKPPEPPPTAPPSPAEIRSQVFDDSAEKIRLLNADRELTQKQKDQASNEVIRQQNIMLAGLAEKEQAIKAREEDATDHVLGELRTHGSSRAYAMLDNLMKDPSRPLSEKMYNLLSKSIEQDTNDPNPRDMGKSYTDALKRLQLPAADPQHIGEYSQILEMKTNGELTKRGADDVFNSMIHLRKEEDEGGLQAVRTAGLDAFKKIFTEYDELTHRATDGYGEKLYETKGVEAYNVQYNAWRKAVREGKADPSHFPLADPKKLTEFANMLYPPGERPYLRLQDQHPELPDIPANVDQKGFGEVFALAKVDQQRFGDSLVKLASDPKTVAPLWNAGALGQQISAEAALAKMGIPYTPPPRPAVMPARPVTPTPQAPTQIPYGAAPTDPNARPPPPLLQMGPANPNWHLLNPALRRDIMHAQRVWRGAQDDLDAFMRSRSTGPQPSPPIYAPPPRESE